MTHPCCRPDVRAGGPGTCFWSDGPTVAGMRAKAEKAARTLPEVDADRLVYDRQVQPRSYALTMIRQLRLGQPPLGHHEELAALGDWLRNEPYPERGDAAEVELADRLVHLSRGLEAAMVGLLDQHGLAVPTGTISSDTVIPLRRDR